MEKKARLILTLGVAISLPMILMSALGYVFDFSKNSAFGWSSFIVFVATLYIAQRYYRNELFDGIASYKQLFGGTLLMIIVAAVIMFIYTYVFYKLIAPDQIQKMLDMVKIQMYDSEMTEAQAKQAFEFNRKYIMNPLSMSIISLGVTIFQGLIVSLIISIFNKKKLDGFSEIMKDVSDTE